MKRRQPLFHCRTIGESAESWQWIDNDTDDIFQSERINKYLTNVYRDIQNLIFYAYWMNEYPLYIVIVFGPEKNSSRDRYLCATSQLLSQCLTDTRWQWWERARFLLFATKDTHRDPTTNDRNIDGAYEISDEVKTRNRERERERRRDRERERASERHRERERKKYKRRKERYRERENRNSRQWSDDSFCRPPEILIREDPSEIFFFKALFSKRQTKRDERKT